MLKRCSKCKKELDFSCFTKDKQKHDGLRPNCKMCAHRWALLNGKVRFKEVLSVDYKRCTKCRKVKLKTDFLHDRQKKDGFYSSCKDCVRKKNGTTNIRTTKNHHLSSGYITKSNCQRVHRMLMEKKIGRKLEFYECVHHINGNKLDNRIENLQVISSHDHGVLHYPDIKHKMVSNYEREKNCVICGKIFITKSGKAKFCSKHCEYLHDKEYVKSWILRTGYKQKRSGHGITKEQLLDIAKIACVTDTED